MSSPTAPSWGADIIDKYKPESPKRVLEYIQAVTNILPDIEGRLETPDGCKVSIQIPAYCKERNLKQTLLHYAQQFPHKEGASFVIEIIVDINGPSSQEIEQSEALKDCREIAEQYPQLNICIMKQAVSPKNFKIGNIRWTMAIFSAKRALNNPKVDMASVIVITNDADLKGLSPRYVEEIYSYFAKHADIHAAGTFIDYPDFQITSNHLGIVVQRCEEMLEAMDKRKFGHKILRSWSSAYRMESLLNAGTFPTARKWESGQVVRNIKKRLWENSIGLIPKHIVKLTTSARRHATAILTGTPISDRYSTFGTENDLAALYHNEEKRAEARKTVVIVQDTDFQAKLEKELQEVYNKRLRAHIQDAIRTANEAGETVEDDLGEQELNEIKEDIQKEFTKISPFIGIKFNFPDNDTLKITDMKILSEKLREKFSVLD